MKRDYFKNFYEILLDKKKFYEKRHKECEKGFERLAYNAIFISIDEVKDAVNSVQEDIDRDINTLFDKIDSLERICEAQSQFIKDLQEYVKEDDLQLKQTMKKIITNMRP